MYQRNQSNSINQGSHLSDFVEAEEEEEHENGGEYSEDEIFDMDEDNGL